MDIFKNIFSKRPGKPKCKTLYMVIDEQIINAQGALDVQKVIEPLWWSVSIYDGEEQYENDLKSFTTPQRYVFAIQWYSAEVNNGGHFQFYDNSTGIVWEDALKGFETIGAQQNMNIIKESANRIGRNPSKDREKRQEQMERYNSEFDDLDKLYYEIETNMLQLLTAYIQANAKDFAFSGEVTVPNLLE